MEETLHNAIEELKRVEHLVYVSLKYTRTVDVLMNIINRMVDAYDYSMKAILMKKEEEGAIGEIPDAPIAKAELMKELFGEEEDMVDNISLYILLRKIQRTSPERENEYRRHVTLITFIENREERVDIDTITAYYTHLKAFIEQTHKILEL